MAGRKILLLVLAAALLTFGGVALAENDVGEQATDFALWDQNMDYHTLYQYWGKVIVLNFGSFW